MANIITVLLREVEKNNTYMDVKGNTVNVEKIEALAKKSYVADLKAGTIDFSVSFNDYFNAVLSSYMPVDSVIATIKDVIQFEEIDVAELMAEPAEEVAN
jgi:predicted RecB family endonuclease